MRINEKIKEIEDYLDELLDIMPKDFPGYIADLKTKAACERYSEKIIGAVVDLAFLIIKEENFKVPEQDKEAFDILAEGKIISEDLAAKLKDARGMRNIISHQYGNLDDEIVFESITRELEKDVREFIENIKNVKFN